MGELLLTFFNRMKLIAVILLGVTALFALPMLKVWKEERMRELAFEKQHIMQKMQTLESSIVTLEMSIASLSRKERLERYATDSLNLLIPKANEVIVVERSEGVVVTDDGGVKNFLMRLMGGSNGLNQ